MLRLPLSPDPVRADQRKSVCSSCSKCAQVSERVPRVLSLAGRGSLQHSPEWRWVFFNRYFFFFFSCHGRRNSIDFDSSHTPSKSLASLCPVYLILFFQTTTVFWIEVWHLSNQRLLFLVLVWIVQTRLWRGGHFRRFRRSLKPCPVHMANFFHVPLSEEIFLLRPTVGWYIWLMCNKSVQICWFAVSIQTFFFFF